MVALSLKNRLKLLKLLIHSPQPIVNSLQVPPHT